MKSSSMPPPVLTMQSTSLRALILVIGSDRGADVGRALVLAEEANNLSQAAGHTVSERCSAVRRTDNTGSRRLHSATLPADDVRRVAEENGGLHLAAHEASPGRGMRGMAHLLARLQVHVAVDVLLLLRYGLIAQSPAKHFVHLQHNMQVR